MKHALMMSALLPLIAFARWPSALNVPPPAAAKCTFEAEVTGTIGPATLDWLKRVERRALERDCSSVLLLVNTPGGSLESTRRIVELILNSKTAFLCLVAPSGGHAGSAGAIILQACHVNGGLRGTNLGAATPVSLGQDIPKDLRQKILNDTRSWMESLTRLRGRSEQFGKDIILEAKAVTAEDALKLKAIDFVGDTKDAFLKFAAGRPTKLGENKEATVSTGPVETYAPDLRFHILSLITDPELAYMLLLASLALLYFEITHAGVILPGVLGAVGLVVALVALHKLDVEYGGLALIVVGLGFIIAEAFLPTYGLVGAAGVACLALGSLFLFDPVRSFGYRLPYTLVGSTVGVISLMLAGISYLFLKTVRVRRKGGFEELMGLPARVVRVEARGSLIEVRGELWSAESASALNVNDEVTINGHRGLVLLVTKED